MSMQFFIFDILQELLDLGSSHHHRQGPPFPGQALDRPFSLAAVGRLSLLQDNLADLKALVVYQILLQACKARLRLNG